MRLAQATKWQHNELTSLDNWIFQPVLFKFFSLFFGSLFMHIEFLGSCRPFTPTQLWRFSHLNLYRQSIPLTGRWAFQQAENV